MGSEMCIRDRFTIGSSTYAIAVSYYDDGVQIIDVSDPTNIVAKDAETDGENGFTELYRVSDVDTFTIGSSTYAISTAWTDNGVQIIDISDPTNIVAVDSATDGENGFTKLEQADYVETFTIDSGTYAIVRTHADDGIQMIELSKPIIIEKSVSASLSETLSLTDTISKSTTKLLSETLSFTDAATGEKVTQTITPSETLSFTDSITSNL